MAKVYEFPEGGRQSATAPQKRKPGKVSAWFTRLNIGYHLKNFAANCFHYPLLVALLLLMIFRYPIAIIGGGYCLYYYSALYCFLVVSAVLLSFVAVNLMESVRPFHWLFRASRHNKIIYAANDEIN
ncbi:hypothetical protein J8655_09955 [Dickeya oryzae]|uniref:hypothetical protein n=1 Tax=Dickeya oryzae TaxID=1240404 RepID=UPI001AECDD4E|nr:hypothetical protein [Dickeya oryzae]MBP2845801.1 hypothetical protein [Dickeya oryzae]